MILHVSKWRHLITKLRVSPSAVVPPSCFLRPFQLPRGSECHLVPRWEWKHSSPIRRCWFLGKVYKKLRIQEQGEPNHPMHRLIYYTILELRWSARGTEAASAWDFTIFTTENIAKKCWIKVLIFIVPFLWYFTHMELDKHLSKHLPVLPNFLVQASSFHVAVCSIEAKVAAASEASHGLFKACFQGSKLGWPKKAARLKKQTLFFQHPGSQIESPSGF